MTNKLTTDCLGFPLTVEIIVDIAIGGGQHKTYADEQGVVRAAAEHEIRISPNLDPEELIDVAAHEVYHLFYSVRHLIAVDEETEAQAFGQMVKHVHRSVGATKHT